jgi:hypothetical protein
VWFEPQLYMPTHVGGLAVGPSPFDPGTTGMGIPGFGNGPLPASLTAGVFRGDQTPALHQLPRVLDARQVAECSHGGDGHGALDATQGLERFDDRISTLGCALVVECLLETPQAFRVCMDSPDVFLKDQLLSRGRTDHLREPAPVGRPPGGLARLAEILPQPTRVQPKVGGLEIADGLFTGAAQVPDGCSRNPGDVDRGQVT